MPSTVTGQPPSPAAPLSIVFAGTPEFAASVLDALLQTPHQLRLVLTQPDREAGRGRKLRPSPVKERALQAGLPVLQPQTLRDAAVQQQLRDLRADLMVVVAYGLILPPAVLQAFPLGCINVHASLLPRWRGAAPIQRAIAAGDSRSGITIMQMDRGLDTGDMLAVEDCEISPQDNAQTLHDRLAAIGASLLCATLTQLQAGNIEPRRQDDALATYADKIDKEDGRIDWRQPAAAIALQVRAFNPWPGAFCQFAGQQVKVWEAQAVTGGGKAAPGTVVAMDRDGMDVASGEGLLRITRLQLPGGKAMAMRDFVNARRSLQVGAVFDLN